MHFKFFDVFMGFQKAYSIDSDMNIQRHDIQYLFFIQSHIKHYASHSSLSYKMLFINCFDGNLIHI